MFGDRILGGRYRLSDLLGTGGMSAVWRARDEVLDRTVAVKVLSGRYAEDPEARSRIREEARMAARLSHPNIAQIHDFGEDVSEDGLPHITAYVVMELVDGPTLLQEISGRRLEPHRVFEICAQVAAALAAAHAEGLVHRDVKPGNIMLGPDKVKVVDFGIAATAGPADTGEFGRELLGTPAYLAPERMTSAVVEPASDVYSLGVLLYRLLAGRLPWDAETDTEVLTSHVLAEPRPLPPISGVPDEVARLCLSCLVKDPLHRPSAAEVAAKLAAAAGGPPPIGVPHRRSRRRAALLAVAGVAAAAAVAGWFLVVSDPPGANPPLAEAATGPSVTATVSQGTGRGVDPSGTTPGGAGGGGGTQTSAAGPTGATIVLPEATGTGGGSRTSTPTATPSPTATTGPATAAFTSEGGTVKAVCDAPATARLVSWDPAKSYSLNEVESGPGSRASASFRHGHDIVTMTVTCAGGTPSVAIQRS